MKKKTRFVILGLLRDKDMTGYELKNCIDLRMSFFWQESYGQIYPELNLMLREGLVVSHENHESNNRGKIKYSITENGIRVFNDWMSKEYEKDTVRSEALLKFFLADDNNKSDIMKHLEQFYNRNKDVLKLYENFRDSLNGYEDIHNHRYILHMLDLGIKQQKLYCDWSSEYLDELKDK